jgi:hypothetical protein
MRLARVTSVTVLLCVVFLALADSAKAQGAKNTGSSIARRILGDLALGYIKAQVQRGTPLAEGWLRGSPESLALLNAYKASSLYEVADQFVRNLEPEVTSWQLAGPDNAGQQKAEATSSDKFAQVRGFKVEISGSSGKEVDTAWESVSGGDMVIEHTETTIGDDKFRTNSPGHKTVNDITLLGPLASTGDALAEWIDCINGPAGCRDFKGTTGTTLNLIGERGAIASFDYTGFAAYFFQDEVLIIWADEKALHTTSIKVYLLDAAGEILPPAPRLLTVSPASAPRGLPVLLTGTGIGPGAEVFFNGHSNRTVTIIRSNNLPLLDNVTVGLGTVPVSAPRGKGDVMIEYNGQQSNRFPFTVR